MIRALVVGGKGQLGRSLVDTALPGAVVTSYGADTLDITDRDAITVAVAQARPDILFNAAAYTAVDKAEIDEASALAVNAAAVGYLAAAARGIGARFVHVSTDFVFDGRQGVPYAPDASPHPLNAYGRTKLAGEQVAGDDALIVRTAWVYGPTGGNFVQTMLHLLAERSEVRVVADQIGTPTYAPALAGALWTMAAQGVTGIHHYTDAGVASWYDFAVAIQEEALAAGLLRRAASIIPIASADYPTAAVRPSFSVLDKARTYAVLGGPAPHWRVNLRRMLAGANRMACRTRP